MHKLESRGTSGFKLEHSSIRKPASKNGKVYANTARILIEEKRLIDARPHRRGYKNYSWPLQDRAILDALSSKFKSVKGVGFPQLLDILNHYLPEIGNDYEKATGRKMTYTHIYHRIDKGNREKEQETYKHFLESAFDFIKNWKYPF